MIDEGVEIELARHQWAEGQRALRRAGADPAAAASLGRQVEIVSAEIARRLGQVFTLAELVGVYRGVDRWALGLIQDALGDEVPSHSSNAADAAFDLYARRASDYVP
jgi:hypothetical protein